MKTTRLILGLALAFLAFSCNKDDNKDDFMTTDEVSVNAKIDMANDEVSNFVEEQLTSDDGISGKTSLDNQTLPPCASVSRVPDYGTVITPGTTITKTLNFGTTDCTLPNGNKVHGIIVISFLYQPTATSHTITYTFQNFYHNGIKFEGTKTFTRVMSVATATSSSHPIVTMNMDLTATFPNGNVYTRVGSRVREIKEGYATPTWTDNVYQVTGSWTTSFPNTTVQTATITTPLHIKMSCASLVVPKPILVSGVITFERNNHTATLDYGNGQCDNTTLFTMNGISIEITFGN